MTQKKWRWVAKRLTCLVALSAVLGSLGGCRHRHSGIRGEEAAEDRAPPPPPPAPVVVSRFIGHSVGRRIGQPSIAYDHSLTLTVPSEKVSAHLVHLRDYCLGLTGCELISASAESEGRDDEGNKIFARLSARLSHEKIDAFLAIAAAPIAGEVASAVVTQTLRTNERDLNSGITDVDRRLVQLTAFRDRLEALEAQSAGKTDDLIKVAKELSEAQTALESGMREKKDLSRQVDTEEVTIYFESTRENLGPLRRSWRQSGMLLSESLADLWAFSIQALVWAPLVVLALLLVRRAVRRGWFSRS